MTKRELKLEDGRTLKEWVADNREPASEQTDLRERIEEALNGLVLVLPQHESIPFKMVEITLSKDAEWIPQIVSRIMPLLPQSAAPQSQDAERAAPNAESERDWINNWIEKHVSPAFQGKPWFINSLTAIVTDFAKSFPPSLKLSRDEIVKRGDAKTCHWCRIGLPLEKSEETSSELITPIKWHPDKPHGHTCVGRGTAIYELILEAVGAKP